MVGGIFVFRRNSTGKMDKIAQTMSKSGIALNSGLIGVIKSAARLVVVNGKERKIIIGDQVVYILPKGDLAFILVLERSKARKNWEEKFCQFVDELVPFDEHNVQSEFVNLCNDLFLDIQREKDLEQIPLKQQLSIQQGKKIVLTGLSKAGKTSIVKRVFEQETEENALNTKPTVLRSIKKHMISFLGGHIVTFDLGGQQEFLISHLTDESAFSNLAALIFVIDVQDEERFPMSLNYFVSVMERLKEAEDTQFSSVSVFLHKYDPNLRVQLLDQLSQMITKILDSSLDFPIVFHPTSIFDDSLPKAIVRTLFYSLPGAVLEQAITSKKLLTIHHKLQQLDNPLKAAIEAGQSIGEDILEKWLDWASGVTKKVEIQEPTMRITLTNGNVVFQLRCPIPENMKSQKCCELTSHILTGFCQMLGIEAPIPQKSSKDSEDEFCYFLASK